MGNGERGALKKLEGAARYWLGADKPKPKAKPLAVDEEAAQALRRVGVKEEDIEAALAQEEEAEAEADESLAQVDFEVHEDNWESVMFFLKVQTQWSYRGMEGHRGGLNNTAVESTMRMAGVKRAAQAALLADLQVMERAVLKADAERAAKAGD